MGDETRLLLRDHVGGGNVGAGEKARKSRQVSQSFLIVLAFHQVHVIFEPEMIRAVLVHDSIIRVSAIE